MENENQNDPDTPEDAFARVVALRHLADQLERGAVKDAIREGWSWSRIAQALGVSKQAAHKRLKHLIEEKRG